MTNDLIIGCTVESIHSLKRLELDSIMCRVEQSLMFFISENKKKNFIFHTTHDVSVNAFTIFFYLNLLAPTQCTNFACCRNLTTVNRPLLMWVVVVKNLPDCGLMEASSDFLF